MHPGRLLKLPLVPLTPRELGIDVGPADPPHGSYQQPGSASENQPLVPQSQRGPALMLPMMALRPDSTFPALPPLNLSSASSPPSPPAQHPGPAWMFSRSRRWSAQEENDLEELVHRLGVPNNSSGWDRIAQELQGADFHRGFTESTCRLHDLAPFRFFALPSRSKVPGRTGKQVKERWRSHLAPENSRDAWTDSEDRRLLRLQGQLGNSWAGMLGHFPGRSYTAVKNRWYGTVRFLAAKHRPE